MATKFLSFLVVLRGVVQNKILLPAESHNIWLKKKFHAGYATARGPVFKIISA